MDRAALSELARRVAAHPWVFSPQGLQDAVRAFDWQIVGREGDRVDISVSGLFEPAWAMCFDDDTFYVEATLAPPIEIDPLDHDAIEDTEVEMFRLFTEAEESVAEAIGQPLFSDGSAHPQFPDDEDGAEWLAYWRTDNVRLSVKQLHEDQELPFGCRLCWSHLNDHP